jgi:hypothetical protein
MASIIIFSSPLGHRLRGKDPRRPAGQLLAMAPFLLIGSTVLVGYGNYCGLAAAGRWTFLNTEPSVDDVDLTGGKRRLVRGEIHRQGGNFFETS